MKKLVYNLNSHILTWLTYDPQQKSWHTLEYLSGNLSVHTLPPSSMLFNVMKLSLCVYNIVGEDFWLVMPLGIVPKIPCQRIFVPFDPSVPRTFVMDCSSESKLPFPWTVRSIDSITLKYQPGLKKANFQNFLFRDV